MRVQVVFSLQVELQQYTFSVPSRFVPFISPPATAALPPSGDRKIIIMPGISSSACLGAGRAPDDRYLAATDSYPPHLCPPSNPGFSSSWVTPLPPAIHPRSPPVRLSPPHPTPPVRHPGIIALPKPGLLSCSVARERKALRSLYILRASTISLSTCECATLPCSFPSSYVASSPVSPSLSTALLHLRDLRTVVVARPSLSIRECLLGRQKSVSWNHEQLCAMCVQSFTVLGLPSSSKIALLPRRTVAQNHQGTSSAPILL